MTPSRCAAVAAVVALALAVQSSPVPADDQTAEPKSATATASPPLITTGRIGLNLGGAEAILDAAKAKAAAMGLKVNIAIADDGGHLLSFARMDGARPASGYTALTKAISAATFRQESGTMPINGEPDPLLSLSLQNAALAGGGKVTTLKGGVPVVVEGQIIGAVGVGGGTGDQDAEIAKAGIQALLGMLKTPSKG